MIKRLDSTSTAASRASTVSAYSVNSTDSRQSSTSTSSAALDPTLIPRAYHEPSVFKAVDTQEDTAHNASINRHLLVSSQNKSKDEKSSFKVKGMMWALTAARV